MNSISKPHIVDLLRIFDKRRLFMPRIRYAYVRSKPELLRDLLRHFTTKEEEGVIYFIPRVPVRGLPDIHYNLLRKKFFFDKDPVDVPTQSRLRPVFSIRRGPVQLLFP